MNSDVSAVKALVFDVFGTTVDWRSSIIQEAQAFGARKGMIVDWAGLVDQWRANYEPSMQRVRIGELPWTKLDVLHRMTLDQLLRDFGVQGLDEAEIDWLNRAWHRLKPWPDVISGLTRLRRKFTIGTLSNGNVSLLSAMAKSAGLPWDCIFSAELARHYKPDAETWLKTAELLSLPTNQVMLVAAHNDELVSAAEQGYATAFVGRPAEYGPLQCRDFKADHDFDIVARDFNDLADRLGAL
jgi:2-haloacid dehalogenase